MKGTARIVGASDCAVENGDARVSANLNQNNNNVSFAPQPIIIPQGQTANQNSPCSSGTYVDSHVEKKGNQKEFFVCIKKPDINPCLDMEHRAIYSEQQIRLDQGLDILDRNGLNYNLEIDINHDTIFMAHMSKLLSKSGYFFDSVVNFRPNYDFENSRIEVKNPEITPDVFSSLLDLIYFRTVKTCREGLQAIGRAAQILDMAEVVKACQELQDPASVQSPPPPMMPMPPPGGVPAPPPPPFAGPDPTVCPPPLLPGPCVVGPEANHAHAPIYPGEEFPVSLPHPVTGFPHHHHHPIPRRRKAKTCCQGKNCGHCNPCITTCKNCEEEREDFPQPERRKPLDSCCVSNGGQLSDLNLNECHPDGYRDDRCDFSCEDGTPPCKTALQLLFDAMDRGANEQFHEAYNTLMDNFVQISMSKDFLNLNHHQLVFILSSDSLRVPDEMFVYRAALRWMQFDLMTRLHLAAKVLKPIRFKLLTWEQLKEVQNEALFSNERSVHALLKPALSQYRRSGGQNGACAEMSRCRRYVDSEKTRLN